jgi:hypothetical protein
MKLAERVALTALSKVGVREQGGNNKGPGLREFFAADSYKPNATDDGYAWCAAFVCWVIMTAIIGLLVTFKRPTTPGAWAFEKWALAQDNSVRSRKNPGSDILRGDIVVFKISHIGVAVSAPNAAGYFYTVEGNTGPDGGRDGDGVYRKRRHISAIRSRLRFTV